MTESESQALRRSIRALVAQIDRLEDELREAKAEAPRAAEAARARAVAVIEGAAVEYERKGHPDPRFPPDGEHWERAKLLRQLACVVRAT